MCKVRFHSLREPAAGIITVRLPMRELVIPLPLWSICVVRLILSRVTWSIVSSSSIWSTVEPGIQIWEAATIDHTVGTVISA